MKIYFFLNISIFIFLRHCFANNLFLGSHGSECSIRSRGEWALLFHSRGTHGIIDLRVGECHASIRDDEPRKTTIGSENWRGIDDENIHEMVRYSGGGRLWMGPMNWTSACVYLGTVGGWEKLFGIQRHFSRFIKVSLERILYWIFLY